MKRLIPKLLWIPLLALTWLGLDFSPGFSAIFTAVFIVFYAFGSLLFSKKETAGRVLMAAGTAFLFPAVYIYAAGDDFLSAFVYAALIGTAVLYLIWRVLDRTKLPLSEHVLRILLLGAALFTLLCGIPSTALLPLGFGAAVLLFSRAFEKPRDWLTAGAVLLCCIFLVAPMLYPGGAL